MRYGLIIILLTLSGCAQITSNPSMNYESPADELINKGWGALNDKDYESAHRQADECVALYSAEAKEINASCADQSDPSKYGRCWAVNTVGECLALKAEAYYNVKNYEAVKDVCSEIQKYYFNSFIFDPRGWPWKPAEYCKDKIEEINKESE